MADVILIKGVQQTQLPPPFQLLDRSMEYHSGSALPGLVSPKMETTLDLSKGLWHNLTSDSVIDLVLTILLFLTIFMSLFVILVDVMDMPLMWFTTLLDDESPTANQGGDGNLRDGSSSSSSHGGSPGSRPDEGGDLPPRPSHPRPFLPFFRCPPNAEQQQVTTGEARTIRFRGVLTRSSAITKLSDRFSSSSESLE